MNTPDETIKAGWSAEFVGHDTWRDLGGTFDSWWEAGMALIEDDVSLWRAEAKDDRANADEIVSDGVEIDVGIFRDPKPPEQLIDADDIIETMLNCCHEDYMLECAEHWLSNVTEAQKDDLTACVRATVCAWLLRSQLYPDWKVIGKSWTVTAGQIRAKANEMRSK